jgi:hypothetical protein
MKNLRKYIFWLLVAATAACSSNCQYCNPTPAGVDAKLTVSGEVASDCNYFHLTTVMVQDITIVVSGINSFSRSYHVTNNALNTYAIEVPSSGSFTITVEARELGGDTCPMCTNKCGQGVNGKPRLKGSQTFSSVAATYDVIVSLGNANDDCIC